MSGAGDNESSIQGDFTVEKRFHLVPAANLLITIPFTNDRLVLRTLDIGKALDELGGDYFFVTSPSNLHTKADKAVHHQIEARFQSGRHPIYLDPRAGRHDRLTDRQADLATADGPVER